MIANMEHVMIEPLINSQIFVDQYYRMNEYRKKSDEYIKNEIDKDKLKAMYKIRMDAQRDIDRINKMNNKELDIETARILKINKEYIK